MGGILGSVAGHVQQPRENEEVKMGPRETPVADDGDAGSADRGLIRHDVALTGFLWASGKTQSMNVDLFISVLVRTETCRNRISPGGRSKLTRGRVQGRGVRIPHPPTGGNQEGKLPGGKRHCRKRHAEWPREGKQS